MSKKILLPLLLSAVLLHIQKAHSQTPLPAERIDLFIEPVGQSSSFDPLENNSRSALEEDSLKITVALALPDEYVTGGLPQQQQAAKIHLKVGTSAGAGDIVEQEFVFDETAGLPAGMSYVREGNTVYLCAGIFTGIGQVYARVEIETVGGQRSAAVSTSF